MSGDFKTLISIIKRTRQKITTDIEDLKEHINQLAITDS